MTRAHVAVIDALKHRYSKPADDRATETPADAVGKDALIACLHAVQADKLTGEHTLLELVAQAQPEWTLADAEQSLLLSVDDCINLIGNLIDLENEIDIQLRLTLPQLAVELLEQPDLPLTRPDHSVLAVLDLLVSACVGWASDLGRSGDQVLQKTTDIVTKICSGESDYAALQADLQTFLDAEQKRIRKLEERLVASEEGQLRAKKCKGIAAQLINTAMADKQLTASIINFLQGPWYDSIQLLALTKGLESEEWLRATKLTETIVWTYQPIEDPDDQEKQNQTQRLYRIVEHIPAEIRELLVALEHNTASAENALEEIESEHVQVISGDSLAYTEFTPLPTGREVFSQKTSVSRILLRKVTSLNAGQWFTFEDEGASVRIKLVLKLEDIKQLLFTNRNGMKALEKSFDEFAYYLSAGLIKPLNHEDVFSSTFSSYYASLVERFDRDRKQAAEDRAEAQRAADETEATEKKALQEASRLKVRNEDAERERLAEEKQQRLANARIEAAKEENQEKVVELTAQVKSLNIGAWLKLPGADGVLEECKLAVKLATADKMIFVSRTGLKVGDYSAEQLVQLLVAGEGEIEDGGVEFEDTLAEVVTKLRQDRNKSYDDLTGS